MARELSDALATLDRDDDIRALIVTGAGSVFCAGADLSGATASRPEDGAAEGVLSFLQKRNPRWAMSSYRDAPEFQKKS